MIFMENEWCILTIDDDKMNARMTLKVPSNNDNFFLTPFYVERFLKLQGISFGINEAAIELLINVVRYGNEIIVASGSPPVEGVDGYVDFHIPVEDSKKPVINEDGSVDYLNSFKLAMVSENQVFATYVKPTAGKSGLNIFSEIVNATPGKEAKHLKGNGFKFDEDTGEYTALYSGHIKHFGNHVSIENVYVVSGDLDIDKGNINFNGDVQIHGDVRSGLSINAEGSVFISGHVGACQIAAGKNITVCKGIQGRDKCIIAAGGDVVCKFVERCCITAKGNIYADSILDSQVTANNQVIVTSRMGILLGGVTTGKMGVTARTCGNETEALTVVCAGPSKEDINRMYELTEQYHRLTKEILQFEDKLEDIEIIPPEKRSSKTEEIRTKLFRAKIVVSSQRKAVSDELTTLSAFINESIAVASVTITGVAYAGTRIRIGDAPLSVTESFKSVKYYCKNDEIIAEGI